MLTDRTIVGVRRASAWLLPAAFLLLYGSHPGCGDAWAQEEEVVMSSQEWQQLDTYEMDALRRADKKFAEKSYSDAAAYYIQFISDFAKSKAIPYALLRQGRCKQLVDKRKAAIKLYQELLDYFPNEVNYAAPALYYQGRCHEANGDLVEKMKAFADMANDVEYRKHKFAPVAIFELGSNLATQNRLEEAIQLYKQLALDVAMTRPDVAGRAMDMAVDLAANRLKDGGKLDSLIGVFRKMSVDLRTARADVAGKAMELTIDHIAGRLKDTKKLWEYYLEVRGFAAAPIHPNELPKATDVDNKVYWQAILPRIDRCGGWFAKPEQEKDRKAYFKYWGEQMSGKHLFWEEFQFKWIDYMMQWENSDTKWVERMDAEFRRHYKEGDWERVMRWMTLMGKGHPKKSWEYYKMLDPMALTKAQIRRLMDMVCDILGQLDAAKQLASCLDIPKLSDDEKIDVAGWFLKRFKDEASYLEILAMLDDRDRYRYELLKHYAGTKDTKVLEQKTLPLCAEVERIEKYAMFALETKVKILDTLGRYRECISALHNFPNPGAGVFYRIADMYVKLREYDAAVGQLREIQNFFPAETAPARMRIAGLYRSINKNKEEFKVLREVMSAHKETGESSQAHRRIEELFNVGAITRQERDAPLPVIGGGVGAKGSSTNVVSGAASATIGGGTGVKKD